MHSLLTKLLQKRGIKHVNDLPADPMPDGSLSDKQTFENWNRILSSKQEVTVENLRAFCDSQLKEIKAQMRNLDNTPSKNQRLQLLQNVYGAILDAMEAPKTEREALEKYLTGLLHSS